jgi:hypothetical protein
MVALRRVLLPVLAIALWSADASAAPEDEGPYTVGVWENPPGAPVPSPAGIYYPVDAPCAGAPVALVHGAGESGAYKVRMAELMASYGLVAVLPSFPSLLLTPGQTEADNLNALLDWVVEQGDDMTTPIAGKVDGEKYGVAGHSNGGVVFLAASGNDKIQAAIGWDAVAHLDAAAELNGPSLHLRAEAVMCFGGSRAGYDAAPEPKLMGTVLSGTHCDFNDPESPLCVGVCGTDPWEASVAAVIERYSVAFMTCVLGHQPDMAQYLDFGAAPDGLTALENSGEIVCQAECGDGGDESGGEGSGTASGDEGPAESTAGEGGEAEADAGDGGDEADAEGGNLDSTTAAASVTGTGTDTDGDAADGDGTGCGCRHEGGTALGLWVLVLARQRRRKGAGIAATREGVG